MVTFFLGALFGAALYKLINMFYGTDGDYARIQFLVDATNKGYCPAILFDDNGNWAVTFDGWQESDFYANTVDAGNWKPSLREAIDHASTKVEIREFEMER